MELSDPDKVVLDVGLLQIYAEQASDLMTKKHDGTEPHVCYPAFNMVADRVAENFLQEIAELKDDDDPEEVPDVLKGLLFHTILTFYLAGKADVELFTPMCEGTWQ